MSRDRFSQENPSSLKNTATAPTEPAPLLNGVAAKLATLTQTLIDIISRETELLEARKPREAQALHGQKNKAMAEYKITMGQLQTNGHLIGPEDSPARRYIRKLTDNLREILRDHARIVLRLKAVTEGIIKSVGEEITKQNPPVIGYGHNAAYKIPQVAKPMSLALNQVI